MAVIKGLINTTETYRIGTVSEVERFHEELKNDIRFEIASFSYTTKFDKKTEEEYQIVKVKKIFNGEKDIISRLIPDYIEPEFKLNLGGEDDE